VVVSENGRICDVLIVDRIYLDRDGETKSSFTVFDVWTNPGLIKIIENVEGVSYASADVLEKTKYTVYIDLRYDANSVKQEVRAALLTYIQTKGDIKCFKNLS